MNLAELVNSNYSKLNENDLHIVKYILNNKTICSKMGINELADKCNVSKSSVLRLTQKLGLSGYSEFKVFLKWEEQSKLDRKEDEMDYIESLSKSVCDTIKNNNEDKIRDICKVIHEAERIVIYGTGRAQQICLEELKRLFLFTHKYFIAVGGAYEFEALADSLTNKDAVIILSYSGNTNNLDTYVRKLNISGIKVISITKLENNKLASLTPYNLYGTSISRYLNSGEKHNCTVFFYIIAEILFYNYEKYIREIN